MNELDHLHSKTFRTPSLLLFAFFQICFSGRKLDFSGIQAQFLAKDSEESSAENFWGAFCEKCHDEACLHGTLPSGRLLSDHGV